MQEAVAVIAVIAPILLVLVLLFFTKLSRCMVDDLHGKNMRQGLSQNLKRILSKIIKPIFQWKYTNHVAWGCSVLLFCFMYGDIQENQILVLAIFWILFWWAVLLFGLNSLVRLQVWNFARHQERRRKRRERDKMSNNSLWKAAGKVMVRISRVLLLVLISFPLLYMLNNNIEKKGSFEVFFVFLFGLSGGFLVFFILFISGLNYILFDQFYPWAEYKEDDDTAAEG